MRANKGATGTFCLALVCAGEIVAGAGCAPPHPTVIKVGVVAPFEGRLRQIGYDVIPAARLAAREFVVSGSESGVLLEIVAYDDQGDPQRAKEQALKLAADPEVKVVVGHWRDDTTQAALGIYATAGLPLVAFSAIDLQTEGQVKNLAPSQDQLQEAAQDWINAQRLQGELWIEPSADVEDIVHRLTAQDSVGTARTAIGGPEWGLGTFGALTADIQDGKLLFVSGSPPNATATGYWTLERHRSFEKGFREGSLGAPPGPLSYSAYEATWLAIYLATATEHFSPPAPPGDLWQFDDTGRRINAPIYLCEWSAGRIELVSRLH